jgi:hypothetical protein
LGNKYLDISYRNKKLSSPQDAKSATTSRAGGMRNAPGKGRDHALQVVADLFFLVDNNDINPLLELLLKKFVCSDDTQLAG